MAMIQVISGRGTVIQGKFIIGQPSFAPLPHAPKAIQPQMITMKPSPQILGTPQHRPPNMLQQQPAIVPARPQQFDASKKIGSPKLGQPPTIQRQATPMTAVLPRPAPPLLGQPNAIQRQSVQTANAQNIAHRQRQPAPHLGQPIHGPQITIQQQVAKPHLGQTINSGSVHPSRVPRGHIAVQQVRAGDAFLLPVNLSNFGGGGGQPLPHPVLQKMESFFKTSFADVRVHVGPQASSIGALAFTYGSNLYFAPGHYNPHSIQGQQLLGHELTHVVQQRAGRVRNPYSSGIAVINDQSMEAEADRMGLRVSSFQMNTEANFVTQMGRSPKNAGFPATTPPVIHQTIQRTTYRYISGAWISESSSSSDTDTHPDPATYCTTNGITAAEQDRYDRNSGKYFVWGTARDTVDKRAKKKKRPKDFGKYYKDRQTTPYGTFKPRTATETRNAGLQGPHIYSHIGKRAIFELAEQMGLDFDSILGSKLAPKPRQALKMMQDQLAALSVTPKPGALHLWYNRYKEAYKLAEAGGKGWKTQLVKVMEDHPLTAYRIGQVATPAEIAGKDERAAVALDDIDTLISSDRTLGIPSGLTTVDMGFAAESWSAGDLLRQDFVFNYGLMATGRPPSPSPYAEAPMSPPHSTDW